jgi:3-phosphoshikimate 1-carboxyvinyltransferase
MLEALGVTLLREGDGSVGVEGGQRWGPLCFRVPGDISSAAFFMVAAAIVPGSRVRFNDVGVNPTRTGILDVLEASGCGVTVELPWEEAGEPVSRVTVTGGSRLSSFEVSGRLVPRLIDEIPALAVLATQCQGRSVFRDARELRVKESDRIEAMARGLTAMGASVEVYDDGMAVDGPTRLTGAVIDASGDHRVAMAFAVASLVAEGPTIVTGAESVRTSYPEFLDDLRSLSPSTW